jgi:hypothetical protein
MLAQLRRVCPGLPAGHVNHATVSFVAMLCWDDSDVVEKLLAVQARSHMIA